VNERAVNASKRLSDRKHQHVAAQTRLNLTTLYYNLLAKGTRSKLQSEEVEGGQVRSSILLCIFAPECNEEGVDVDVLRLGLHVDASKQPKPQNYHRNHSSHSAILIPHQEIKE
jgi:hypothetical protein